MEALGLFGYGSLVDPASAGRTLGRPVAEVWPARLPGWRRRFSQARDNETCEKTFARCEDGSVPGSILGLNVERSDDPALAPNGALIAVTEDELDRLDLREIRYDRHDVSASVAAGRGCPGFERVLTYVAKSSHLAPEPPAGAVILKAYADAVEAAFEGLGPGQGAEYRRTTLPYPVELIEGRLVRDRIPEGNPRDW
jgi:cation transport regulator ChaC